jgi:hypothetical protein
MDPLQFTEPEDGMVKVKLVDPFDTFLDMLTPPDRVM